jgi:glycosyltransferase involved in cell wall biosynthesis
MPLGKDKNPEAPMWIALLGKPDVPTDGVEDYCVFLAQALARQGVVLQLERMVWAEHGWLHALHSLWRESAGWRGSYVLLQYTALGWSRRGFPFGALVALAILRRRGVSIAVVFHDPCRQGTSVTLRDRIRGHCQEWVIRSLYKGSAKSIFTIPVETVDWIPRGEKRAAFIPIGANIPECFEPDEISGGRNGTTGTFAVFCLSSGSNRFFEVADMAYAARCVFEAAGRAHLIVLGKGSEEMRAEIEDALAGSGVDVSVLGRLPAEDVSARLSKAAAMLFVCGRVSQRRGSALAALACGLPIVGYSGGVAGTPMEEAGVFLAPYRDQKALGAALARVMIDEKLQLELRDRSRRAQERYFSWNVIAKRYIQIMKTEHDEVELSK